MNGVLNQFFRPDECATILMLADCGRSAARVGTARAAAVYFQPDVEDSFLSALELACFDTSVRDQVASPEWRIRSGLLAGWRKRP